MSTQALTATEALMQLPEDMRKHVPKEIIQTLATLKAEAEAFVIDSPEKFVEAFERRQELKVQNDAFYAGITLGAEEAHKMHRKLTTTRTVVCDALREGDAIYERKRIQYSEDAEKAAKEKSDRDRAQLKQQQDDAAMEHAEQLHAAGETEGAEAVLDHAATASAPAVYVAPAAPKSKGQVNKTRYSYTVDNEDMVPEAFKMKVLDLKTIKARVDSLGLKANIPGIVVTEVKSEQVRGK